MASIIKNGLKEILNLPNAISFIRLLLAIPIYFTINELHTEYNYRYWTVALMLLAFITDILDGYTARKHNTITEFGKIIDPFADKTLMVLIVIQLYRLDEIPAIFFWIIAGRDILIFCGGIYVSKKIGEVLPSNLLGKLTVLTIGIFILTVVIGLDSSNIFYGFLFYLSIIMSFASVVGYSLRAYELMKWKNDDHL